jgi:hypothetical protein
VPNYNVDWISGGWRERLTRGSGWRLNHPDPQAFRFPFLSLQFAPRRLGLAEVGDKSATSQRSFRRLIKKSKGFRDWWLQTCGGRGHERTRFLLQFPRDAWDIPWELLVGELLESNAERVSIVRGMPGQPRRLPAELDRPLKVLLVLGDENRTRPALDLQGEAALVIQAWEGLPSVVRQALTKPTVEQPTATDLRECLVHHRPDLLWFSGHATPSPPELFMKGGGALTPTMLGEMLAEEGLSPAFAVFWACETARRGRGCAHTAPPFYTALANIGCMQVLAMQERVSDAGAILMATQTFEALASGEALDVAAARARSAMMGRTGDGFYLLDWACPTVWGSGLTAPRIAWSTPASGLAALQVGVARARRRLTLGGFADLPAQREDATTALISRDTRLVWFIGNTYGADRERWVVAIGAVQRLRPVFAVIVVFDGHGWEPGAELRMWAESLLTALEPLDTPSGEFRNVLEEMTADPHRAWSRLCQIAHILISVINPPPYLSCDWFWSPIRATEAPVAILANEAPDQILSDGWSLEDVGMDEAVMEGIIPVEPMAAALSLIRVPVPEEALGLGREAPVAKALVRLHGRYVTLAGPVVRRIRAALTEDELRSHHVACFRILTHESLSPQGAEPPLHEERLYHALAAMQVEAVVLEATVLLRMYREQDRPRAAVHVFGRVKRHWKQIPPKWLVYVAWAYVMIGDMASARLWLDRAQPSDRMENAWCHGLWSEIHKASGETGSKQQALDEINLAIGALRGDLDEEEARRTRSYRQDHARILHYLFRQPDAAVAEWEALLSEWQGEPKGDIDRAYVLRNLSSALRDTSTWGTTAWERGKRLLETALEELGRHPDHPLVAEILYEQARCAIADGRRIDAERLLREAARGAVYSGNSMLRAIAETRRFWEFESFDIDRWSSLRGRLRAFPKHGWAVRTSITGGLRAARRLDERDRSEALCQLKLCRDEIELNPSFDEGSDRFRIAATAAGTREVAADDRDWAAFLLRPWARTWLETNGWAAPDQVWAGVI